MNKREKITKSIRVFHNSLLGQWEITPPLSITVTGGVAKLFGNT